HSISNGLLNYGYFRDEFYYIACSDHLALGYVDQPPFSIILLAVSRFLFGDSLFAIRLIPALAGAATVFFTGLMVRRLGGGRFAQVIAAVAVIAAPIFLGLNTYYSMNSFDILFWTLGFYVIILILQEGKQKHWLWLGAIIGLGLLNKISLIFFIGGFAVALLLTEHRKKILGAGPWLAALVVALLFLPHVIWQISNDYPTLEFIRNATSEKMVTIPFMKFTLSQVRMMHVVIFPLWFAGLLYFLLNKEGRRYRLFGFMYLAVFLFLMFSRSSRAYYLAPFYTVLLAAGGIWFETFTKQARQWLRPIYLVMVIAAGMIWLPLNLPILPVESYIKYAKFMGKAPSTDEKKSLGKLGQFYADMHGWEKLTETVANAFNQLSKEEKQRCTIFTGNYGEAGAIDLLGKKYNLPPAISGHNNYWFWGPGDKDINVVIKLNGSPESLKKLFTEVTLAATFTCDYCMPYENNMPIYICKGIKVPLNELWPRLKHYD
ncbi:MAG: glycosyltransferase family 39 protein, partial [bacterium]|nr:glycosyltransferase family 39 protein [bacterium]